MHDAFAGGSERFDGEGFALLHLGLVLALDDGHALPAVDAPLADVVAGQVPDGLDGVRFAVELNLVALHDLLDRGADVSDTDVDARFLCLELGHALINKAHSQP